MRYAKAVALGLGLLSASMAADAQPYTRVQSCSSITDVQASSGGYIDATGNICTSATLTGTVTVGSVSISQVTPGVTNGVQVNAALPAGSNIIGNVRIDQTTPGTTNLVATYPNAITLSTLDIKTVTTGGTAVNAISAGNRVKGGWLQNPISATVALCINEIGTASGTTSSGDTTCIQPGQSYVVAPAAGAVSVVTSDSSHPFSGMGYK